MSQSDSFEQDDDNLWEHQQAAKKLTAQYANRIFAQPLAEGTVRISFGEMSETFDPLYHTAIVVTPELAIEFAQVINQVALRVLTARAEYEQAVREHETETRDMAIMAADAAGRAPAKNGN